MEHRWPQCCGALQCAAVCCSVLQCVAVCCSVLQCVHGCLQHVAMCCSTLQRVAEEEPYFQADISYSENKILILRIILFSYIILRIILLSYSQNNLILQRAATCYNTLPLCLPESSLFYR